MQIVSSFNTILSLSYSFVFMCESKNISATKDTPPSIKSFIWMFVFSSFCENSSQNANVLWREKWVGEWSMRCGEDGDQFKSFPAIFTSCRLFYPDLNSVVCRPTAETSIYLCEIFMKSEKLSLLDEYFSFFIVLFARGGKFFSSIWVAFFLGLMVLWCINFHCSFFSFFKLVGVFW